jgi:hypothetical protein
MSTMLRSRLSTLLLLAAAIAVAQAADKATPAATPAADQRPGYGMVESVTRVAPEESASTGSSAVGKGMRPTYLVRIRMRDGSVQVRSQKSGNFHVGDRVLLTNAGDVVKDW